MKALLFDCDGVLADTERDGHRVAFNEAFLRKGLACTWDVEQYGRLLLIAGGKERMRAFFEAEGWPPQAVDRDAFIRDLHKLKTDLYMEIIAQGRLPVRPGVARIVAQALAEGVRVAVCSTSDARGVTLLAEAVLGRDRTARFAGIFAGDVVSKKKPDPAIYLLAAERLSVAHRECMVVEDSRNGLLAAAGAGMHCIITKSCYTREEDFQEADAVVDDLGDPPGAHITLGDLRRLCG
jgi:HAD superfamily hydrolase (TIGR01509 family)